MTHSRRRFLRWAASMSALAVAGPRGTRLVDVTRAAGADHLFAPNLLISQKDVWAQQVWMAKLGPNIRHAERIIMVRETPHSRDGH